MSFLGLRKTRTPTDTADSLHAHESSSQTPSIKSTNTFRKRLSSFNVFAPKRLRSHVSKKFNGVGFTAAYEPHPYTPSRSPSPEPSLEIRRPSGLGRRASITGDSGEWWAEDSYPRAPKERKRSISTPELSLVLPSGDLGRWPEHIEHEEEPLKPRKPVCMLPRIPLDLLKATVSFVPHSDLPALALTCRTCLDVARGRMYRNVDLLRSDEACVDRCINLLASKRDLAALVETFACQFVPQSQNLGNTSPLPAFTFAIALNNMQNLSSLTLARYDAAVLFHTTFQLRRLTLLCDTAPQSELEGLFAWLSNQPKLTSLSFPNLVLDKESAKWIAGAGSQLANIPEEDQDGESAAAPVLFPPSLLSALDHIAGPSALVSAIVPGRPVASVTVQIHTTIYDGLRPSALVAELAQGSASVTSFALVAPHQSRVDARTIERVLMAAGAELGGTLKVLEIETSLEDQVLYKHVHSILPRYRRLHTLRLRRNYSDQTSRTAPPGHLVAFPTAPPSPSAPSPPGSPGITPLRMQERTQLVAWSKQCPTLASVVFPSGGCWRISESFSGPVYAFVGHLKAA